MSKTARFDTILFSYYKTLDIRLEDVLILGLPDEARAVRGWVIWLAQDANPKIGVLRTWNWMKERGFIDEATACLLVQELVQGGMLSHAWQIWSDYRAGAYGQRDEANRVTNAKFERRPSPGPFDWELRAEPGVRFELGGGLEVLFEGKTNVSMANVRQMAYVHSGPHRLIVDVAHEGLTTDQGPYVRVAGEDAKASWGFQTEMFKGSAGRRKITLDFEIPAGAALARVQLERRASEKFENKIAGKLRLYEVSLLELRAGSKAGGQGR